MGPKRKRANPFPLARALKCVGVRGAGIERNFAILRCPLHELRCLRVCLARGVGGVATARDQSSLNVCV
jgi:hypothetical protein